VIDGGLPAPITAEEQRLLVAPIAARLDAAAEAQGLSEVDCCGGRTSIA
jgi:hypothetical protein